MIVYLITNHYKNLIALLLSNLIKRPIVINTMPKKDSSQSNRSKKRNSKIKSRQHSVYSSKHIRASYTNANGKKLKTKNTSN